MSRIRTSKNPMSALLIALAIVLIGLTGCAHGERSSRIVVSPEFMDRLIDEQERINEDEYPSTISVVDDWIIQNEP